MEEGINFKHTLKCPQKQRKVLQTEQQESPVVFYAGEYQHFNQEAGVTVFCLSACACVLVFVGMCDDLLLTGKFHCK